MESAYFEEEAACSVDTMDVLKSVNKGGDNYVKDADWKNENKGGGREPGESGLNALSFCPAVQNEDATKLLWKLWYEKDQLPLGGVNEEKTTNYLRGYSWAALRTNFNVGRLMFDAGLSSNITADYLFLTHGHSDHSASLYYHTLTKKITIYAPMEITSLCDALIRTTFELSDFGKPFDPELSQYELVGVKAGDNFEIKHDGRPHLVKVYQNDHSVPCVSYGICEKKETVKSEYQYLIDQKLGPELGRLKKEGVNTHDVSFVPRFVFVGDTSEKVFDENPELFAYRDIIVECTFLFNTTEDLDQALKTKHCHWNRLLEYIKKHDDCRFILYHFSLRYRPSDIKNFFAEFEDKDSPNYLKNIYPWISS